MFKRVLFAMFLFAAIVGVQLVSNSKVSAQDVWVYSDKNGNQYYVMTETFNQRERYDYHFDVNVKCVRGSSLISTKKYSFDGHDGVSYSVDGVDKGLIWDKGPVEPASSILYYCAKHFRLSNGMRE